jgi:hypothetical protein
MLIAKKRLISIVDKLPDNVEVEDVFDKILLYAKIDQALLESEEGLAQDWDEGCR